MKSRARVLSRRYASTREVQIEVEAARALEAAALLAARLEAPPSVDQPGVLTARRVERGRIPELIHALAQAGIAIYRVETHETTLEDVYFAIQNEGSGAGVA